MLDFYAQLGDVMEPNHYDVWGLQQYRSYKQSYRIIDNLMAILSDMGVILEGYFYSEEGIKQLCRIVAEKYIDNPIEIKGIIRDYINQRWNLIEVRERYVKITPTDEDIEKGMREIEQIKKTEIEALAEGLDEMIFVGKDIWELTLYSMLSPHAPRVNINGIIHRANLHLIFIGEISTAKSILLNICVQLAPHCIKVTKTTEASFEGVSKRNEIAQGLIEAAQEGSLIIPEFRRIFERFQLLREALDCSMINITKWGITRQIDVNTTFICAANPKKDFFDIGNMRSQIPFTEGVLSRFDIPIILITTLEKNEKVAKKLRLFGGRIGGSNIAEIKRFLSYISAGMKTVRGISITAQQEIRLKKVFLDYNIQIGNRPLVILRDLETLCRLVNIITTTNFHRRKKNKREMVKATDEDVDRAIQLWEYLINIRKQIYEEERDSKELKTPEDMIVEAIREAGGKAPLRDVLSDMMQTCSERSFYRYVAQLEVQGVVERTRGGRNHPATLSLSGRQVAIDE